MKDILLITPPFTQLNTPYPATAYLKGFLNTKNISSFQTDLGIEVILELFSKQSLTEIFNFAFENKTINSENAQRIYALHSDYLAVIDEVIIFLQGKNQTFARQIANENFLPQASRFEQLDDLEWAFGTMGIQDKAKHLATLFLEDLSDFIIECIDENFGFSRYAEKLGRSANSFDELHSLLQKELTYIDKITLKILDQKLKNIQPKLVCISVPFPGNLYSAFRIAQFIKENYKNIKIAVGGGFPTTELRSITDPRVFNFFDYITIDDGELPTELIFKNIQNPENNQLKRTFTLNNGKVVYNNTSALNNYKQNELGTPDYSDLLLDKYISVIEIANPMHSLWSDGRWNKLTMAHGCYWGKCSFCDGSLSYIKDYEPITAKLLVDRMEEMILQTNEKGFHFVDEAAPPALMKALAIEIIKRKLTVTWWTNVRFEKSYTKSFCKLLQASGCIAVAGGLEVASNRLLKLINKGVDVEQVARVTNSFTEAGIMVHAYLMYGFPTQTEQETIDSLEMVRQMFDLGIIQSGFWHQFALTAHSPVGLNPNDYGIKPKYNEITFANNDIQFKDKTGIKHEKFSFGLKKSLFNFMHDIGFDFPLNEWFDFKIPKTKIPKDYILSAIELVEYIQIKDSSKLIWLSGKPQVSISEKTKKGQTTQTYQLTFHNKTEMYSFNMEKNEAELFLDIFEKFTTNEILTYAQLKEYFNNDIDNLEDFWYSEAMEVLKEHGLVVV